MSLVFTIGQAYNRSMLIRKAVRYRLQPTPEQENLLARATGCARFVWNRALSIQKSYLEQGCGILSYGEMAKCLTSWRNGEAFGFLSESPIHPQQWALKFLDRALKDAFNKQSPKRFPVFKKKGRHDSFRYPDPEQIKVDLRPEDSAGRRILPKIFLPRIGWVKCRKSCIIGGEICNVTVSRSGGHWYAAIQIEKEISDPDHSAATAVGGDRGVANLLTLSDGTLFLPVTAYRELQGKLAREQRKLAKKQKFSANWKKQKAKIARLHQRIAEMRKTVLHQVSTTISKNHAVVVLEDLKVQNMTASAKGTVEQPGDARFGKKRASTRPSSTRAGACCSGSWSTSSSGLAECCCGYRPNTPRKSVRSAAWWMRRIARLKPCSTVSTVDTRIMPM